MEWLAVTEVTEGKNIPPTSDRGLSRNMMGLEETVDFFQGVYRRHRVVQNHTQHQDRQTACEIQNFQIVMEEMQVFLDLPLYPGAWPDIPTYELWSILGGHGIY